ncbi:prolipoprotein diacylglyceryl transferase [Agrilactobacillus fermenti]|uniref:prolipoprotein diacylglyceryl transferase n=1 Tax=Agrilactobacillus fermenti TaxID=2586909 RepID=UPI001E31E5B5|nr:prolipoprotein diacylglyceryl transferase [Agrilactobacillus fermenti]MCD2256845.1 prolipoprotein diacylglyceryl transferase [Agrilactobacillus fermenti]
MNLALGAIDPVAFTLGPIAVRWYGIIIAAGVAIAVILTLREAPRRQIMPDDIVDLILWMLPFALIGARTYYVAFEWQYYKNYPWDIFKIWQGGIAIYGGLLAALIVIIVFCAVRMIPVWLLLDIIAPTVLIAQSMGRWGNFINQEAFGAKVSQDFLENLHIPQFIIDQMWIHGAYRQPTFLYESLWTLIGFIILMSVRHRQHLFKRGEVFLSYVIWYGIGRAMIEGMRTDSLMWGSIRVSQALSIILVVLALGLAIYRRHKVADLPWYLDGSGLKYPYQR